MVRTRPHSQSATGSTAPLRAFGRPLRLQSPSLCPELRVWLLGEDVDLEAECNALGEAAPPYWAFAWGAGQLLARYLLDHPEVVRGRRVVDFGAGSGLVGLAAARAGAIHVTSVDLDPRARQALRANARANKLTVRDAASAPARFDVALAADTLYEAPARAWLLAQARAGRELWLAEPERPGTPAPPAELSATPLLRAEARTFPDVDSPVTRAAVYVCRGRPGGLRR